MNWVTPLTFPALEENEIHIWLIDLKNYLADVGFFEEVLSFDEIQRAQRFQGIPLYQKFVVFRGMLRQILGAYLQLPAKELLFNYTKNGKPYVNSKLNFNISHSKELAVFAVTYSDSIGIDIEYKRPIKDFYQICNRFLSLSECAEIYAASKEHQLDIFYNIWVKKEAYIKALGGRLFEELARLKQLDFKEKVDSFFIQNIDINEAYVCGLARTFDIKTVKCWQGISVPVIGSSPYLIPSINSAADY